MSLLLSELGHLLITLLIGLMLYRKFKTFIVFPAVFLTGFLLDVDHLVDYFLFYGLHFNLGRFLLERHFIDAGTVIVPLHGWEYIPLLVILGVKTHHKAFFYALAFGLLGHITWDLTHNQAHFLSYSILYRTLNHFSLSAFH